MRWSPPLRPAAMLAAVLACGAMAAPASAPAPQTVCTITVNSADEKEVFRNHLPEARYRFVELVERGRPDWLASACRADVACDVLIISGHYDGAHEFFSDRLEVREHLPVAELERASCSGSCPSLFSRLKEVHLYGCNTLNPAPLGGATAEIVRGLVREGHPAKEAERRLKALNAGAGESSRDRMRQIFMDVPVIYGFSSSAPLGPIAAATLERYFHATGLRELAQGHPSGRLLGHFAPFAMSVAQGITDHDPLAAVRRDVCRLADDRVSDADRLDVVHELLQRPTPDAWVHLDRIQRLAAALADAEPLSPDLARARERLVRDAAARTRFLDVARTTAQPASRARLIDVARDLGWLSAEQRWQELALMLGDLQARRDVGLAEVDLACTLNREHDLDGAFNRRVAPGGPDDDVPHAAVRACLGSAEAHARTLQALVGPDEAGVQIAQAYLRHRPLTDPAELRGVAADIAAMRPSDAQVRALEALGRHYLSDGDIVDRLARLFAATPSWSVQAAIAGILIRADRRAIASPRLLRTLVDHRLPSPGGDNMVDALLRRLQSP